MRQSQRSYDPFQEPGLLPLEDVRLAFVVKVVLPILVLDLSYEALEISDGEMASSAYLRMREEREKNQILFKGNEI